MYILYVMLFMAGLIAMADWRSDARKDTDVARSDAVATQMASYHQQVMAYCQTTVCEEGPVELGQALPWHMRDATVYGNTIRSAYDGTGLFVTYYIAPGTPIEKGRVADALVTKLHGAANAGRYNAESGLVLRSVFRTGPQSALQQMSLAVPSVVGGQSFVDGMPMIATKLQGVTAAGTPAPAPSSTPTYLPGCPFPVTPQNPLPCAT